jgi:RNA polymerase sigma-70 factor (ECF subfamily)
MRRVVRAKLSDILERELARKRGGSTERLSLDALADALEDEDARDPKIAGALIDDRPGPEVAAERAELRNRIADRIASLPVRQQRIVEGLLDELAMTELSRRLGVPRPTLYDELGRIREAFRDAGLGDLLD